MDATLQYVLQGGALALLAYLLVWTTKSGAPKLFEGLGGITRAIDKNSDKVDRNTEKLADLERTNTELVKVVMRVAQKNDVVGEETIARVKNDPKRPTAG